MAEAESYHGHREPTGPEDAEATEPQGLRSLSPEEVNVLAAELFGTYLTDEQRRAVVLQVRSQKEGKTTTEQKERVIEAIQHVTGIAYNDLRKGSPSPKKGELTPKEREERIADIRALGPERMVEAMMHDEDQIEDEAPPLAAK